MRRLVPLFLAVVASLSGRLHAAESPFPPRPNIIFIMTDDQGYGDLGVTGNPVIKTPNIDKFASESVRLTDYHVSPTCSPTRSVLMSGRHEFHNGVTHTINERERMSLKSTTIAQVLKTAGYTTGIFGKWHLGDEDPYQPNNRGFDEVFIHGAGGLGQSYPGSCGDAPDNKYFNPAIKHNGVFEKKQGYCTDIFFAQATKWMEETKGKKPFFCYIPTNVPHAPLDCPPEYEKRYHGKVPDNAAAFFGMIQNVDDNVGKLMAKVKEWGIEKNTLVVWTTDNGGTAGVKVYNAGMRGQKATPYNGGTHVPFFARWPGVLKPSDVTVLTDHADVFPTIAQIAGAKVPEEWEKKLDGRSLVPLLQDAKAPWDDRTLFVHVGRWDKGQAQAAKFTNCSVRTTQYTLVHAGTNQKEWELYDLKADPGEKTDLAAKHPEVVKKMAADYDKWWDSITPDLVNEDAVGPKVNPFKEQYWKQFGGAPPAEEQGSSAPKKGKNKKSKE